MAEEEDEATPPPETVAEEEDEEAMPPPETMAEEEDEEAMCRRRRRLRRQWRSQRQRAALGLRICLWHAREM